MARAVTLHPKATIDGPLWSLLVKVEDDVTDERFRATYTAVALTPSTRPLYTLKVSIGLQIADTDTLADVADAITVDDIQPGPSVATVWDEWREIAEGNIDGLAGGYGLSDWWASWSKADTNKVRQDFRAALVTGRGWTVTSVHQHEGDGSNTDE